MRALEFVSSAPHPSETSCVNGSSMVRLSRVLERTMRRLASSRVASRSVVLGSSLALACTLGAWSQEDQGIAAASSAPVADMYIQTSAGVMAYKVLPSGAIEGIHGSPFATSGQMEAINGKYLISVGSKLLHSYKIESNGAVGGLVSSINTQNYSGSQCGTTSYDGGYPNGSVLDQTGKYFYVHLYDFDTCDSWQSYKIGGSGTFTFLSDVVTSTYDGTPGDWVSFTTTPSINNSDHYAYSVISSGEPFLSFRIKSSGSLTENAAFTESDPEPLEGWQHWNIGAVSSGYLAAILEGVVDDQTVGPQIASYTIDPTTGSIASTNSPADLPIVAVYNPKLLKASPSGKQVAVAGYEGLQVFQFNGSAPLTALTGLLISGTGVDDISWDNKGHLFALSYMYQQLHVYTVTSTTVTEVAGSPFSIPNDAYGINGMIMVPK